MDYCLCLRNPRKADPEDIGPASSSLQPVLYDIEESIVVLLLRLSCLTRFIQYSVDRNYGSLLKE